MTYSMSTNFDCDTETRLEGEDREILAVIKAALDGNLKSIATMRFAVSSKLAKKCLAILEEGISDVMHDASLAYAVDKATDSAAEARVVTIAPRQVAMAGMSERLDADALKVAS